MLSVTLGTGATHIGDSPMADSKDSRPLKLRLAFMSPREGGMGTVMLASIRRGRRHVWYDGAFFPHDDHEVREALRQIPPMPANDGEGDETSRLKSVYAWTLAGLMERLYA